MLRTFIAARIPESRELFDLRRRLSQLGESFRPIPADHQHVTLKFLGPTKKAELSEIAAVVRAIAARHASHTVELHGLGAFPNVRRPGVVWVGIRNGDLLSSIAAALETDLSPLGFTSELRPFQPHLTILRIKSRLPDALFSLLEDWSDRPFGTASIETVEIYQSELQRGGSKYTAMASVPLAARDERNS